MQEKENVSFLNSSVRTKKPREMGLAREEGPGQCSGDLALVPTGPLLSSVTLSQSVPLSGPQGPNLESVL